MDRILPEGIDQSIFLFMKVLVVLPGETDNLRRGHEIEEMQNTIHDIISGDGNTGAGNISGQFG
jgi:hypothetical protein